MIGRDGEPEQRSAEAVLSPRVAGCPAWGREHCLCINGLSYSKLNPDKLSMEDRKMKDSIARALMVCLLAAGVTVAAQTPSPGAGQKPAPPAPADAKAGAKGDSAVVRQAAMGGMAEVEHGRLAAQNATHADVKQFGQRMVDDHSKANEELKGLAAKKNITLPTALDAKHQAMQDKLAKMKGDAFDRAYMAHMVAAHGQMLSLLNGAAKTASDPDVKAWAQSKVPTVQEHLKMARDANAKVGGAAKGK
jgi:putative membrane protein